MNYKSDIQSRMIEEYTIIIKNFINYIFKSKNDQY